MRKRTGDSAERYFKTTENIAGVKDQRFQDLALPDVLAWLGIHRVGKGANQDCAQRADTI